jgi:hypothetical protein
VICGSVCASGEAAPELDGAFVVVFDARSTLGLGFGAAVVGAAAVGVGVDGAVCVAGVDGAVCVAGVDGAAWAGVDAPGGDGGGTSCASAATEEKTE